MSWKAHEPGVQTCFGNVPKASRAELSSLSQGGDFFATQEPQPLGPPAAVFLGGVHPPERVLRPAVGGRRIKTTTKKLCCNGYDSFIFFFKNQTED